MRRLWHALTTGERLAAAAAALGQAVMWMASLKHELLVACAAGAVSGAVFDRLIVSLSGRKGTGL